MKNNNKTEQFEKVLFKAADKLRKNMDAAEYKHIVLGLIFLKYISDSFEELYAKIKDGKGDFSGANPEDADEYRAENVFFVPQIARWSYLHSRAKLPSIGKDLDDAMEAIEKENSTLKGILPKVYARPNLDKAALGGLIDLIGNIAIGDAAAKSKDLLGRVYEYFLGEFANAEGKKGGQFYTPKSIVRIMVEMIEPYKGRVFDPACGSGGMFIMSEKFVESHKGNIDDISIYGQESNQTTYRLCRMNLAIRGIDGSQVKWNTEGSFLNDLHKDLKADFVLANPPFNDSDWSGQLLQNDPRWQYGMPPASNANYAWLQHMIYHLSPKGVMACVLANTSLTSQSNNEGEIRKSLIENDLVDCIVALPKQLFYNTGISACIWFISRKRTGNGDRKRTGEVLLIDGSGLGHMTDRTHRDFTDADISKITNTYHEWRKRDGKYSDEKGFCKTITYEILNKHGFILTPDRYIESIEKDDDGTSFEDNLKTMNQFLIEQTRIGNELNKEIIKNLERFYPDYSWNKIDFNNSDILEKLARDLFYQWFIDFNFPDTKYKPYKENGGKMVNTDSGEIPVGWRIGQLSEIAKIDWGNTSITKKSYVENGKYLGVSAAGCDGRMEHKEYDFGTVVISAIGEYCGRTYLPLEDFTAIKNTLVVKQLNEPFSYFAYLGLSFWKIERRGAAQPFISKGDTEKMQIVIPPKEIFDAFNKVINPIFQKIKNNNSQIQLFKKFREVNLLKSPK
jgi:type I restriction enzyme M protein